MDMISSQPIKWYGGKSPLASWLHLLAPKDYTHRNIVYAGGLGEFWNWLPIEGISEAVNDANYELANFYHVLRAPQLFPSFHAGVDATLFGQSEWERAKGHCDEFEGKGVTDYAVWRAVQFFVRYRQSRQGLGKDYATPTTRTRRGMNENVSAWLSAVDGLPECHERLRRVEIRNMDAIAFINQYDHENALFYCDPPYMHETRNSTGEYGPHEMTPDQHNHLLTALDSMDGKFMLSGYHSPMYDNWAAQFDWTCHERDVDNKASSAKSKERKTECVWTNY